MKRIEAIVKPCRLDDVQDVLKTAGVEGMTITEVRGRLPQGTVQMYRGAQYLIDYALRLRIEVVVSDARLATVLTVLEGAARTGQRGGARSRCPRSTT